VSSPKTLRLARGFLFIGLTQNSFGDVVLFFDATQDAASVFAVSVKLFCVSPG
jgi:hypothetical protein